MHNTTGKSIRYICNWMTIPDKPSSLNKIWSLPSCIESHSCQYPPLCQALQPQSAKICRKTIHNLSVFHIANGVIFFTTWIQMMRKTTGKTVQFSLRRNAASSGDFTSAGSILLLLSVKSSSAWETLSVTYSLCCISSFSFIISRLRDYFQKNEKEGLNDLYVHLDLISTHTAGFWTRSQEAKWHQIV